MSTQKDRAKCCWLKRHRTLIEKLYDTQPLVIERQQDEASEQNRPINLAFGFN